MRWALLLIAAAAAALGLLTVLRSPDWISWEFNVVAVQFGYALAVIPLAIALISWWVPHRRTRLDGVVSAVGLVAAGLLLQPCFQAWEIARDLPTRLHQAFGGNEPTRAPFSFLGLVRPWPAQRPHRTMVYSGSLALDFYPAVRPGPAPCVLVIHGGGWDNGDRGQLASFNYALAAAGYAVADLSYRLAPAARWPAQREDVAAALAYVKAHAGELRVDPLRLVLAGRSAGGQIAEAAGYELHDPAIRGIVALYAPSDLIYAWSLGRADDALNSPQLLRQFLGGSPDEQPAGYASASSLFQVDRQSPPTLMVHGTIDTLVWHRHSERLSARLTELGVPNYLVTLPWATHALELNPSGPSGQLAYYAVEAFLAGVCR